MVTLSSGGAGRAFSGAVRPGEELDGSAGGRGWGGRAGGWPPVGRAPVSPAGPGPAPAACPPSVPSSLSAAPAAVQLQRSRWAPRTGRSATSTLRSTGSRVSGASHMRAGADAAGRDGRGELRRPELRSRCGHEPASCPPLSRGLPGDVAWGTERPVQVLQRCQPAVVVFALRTSAETAIALSAERER